MKTRKKIGSVLASFHSPRRERFLQQTSRIKSMEAGELLKRREQELMDTETLVETKYAMKAFSLEEPQKSLHDFPA